MTTRKRVVDAPRAKKSAPRVESIQILVVPDDDPDPSYLDQDEFEDRREEYERGDFHFVGVRAEADVEINGTLQTLTSAGLWGIESDSGNDYIKEVAEDEYNELRKILISIGVSTSQLPQKIERGWIQWRT